MKNPLRAAREDAGLTVLELQHRSGVWNTSIYAVEREPEKSANLRLSTAVALVNALPTLTLADLLRADPGRLRLR
jgi:DNA-binding XRE family transcriptional regulator